MPKYFAIAYGQNIRASHSDLAELHWRRDGIAAEFYMTDGSDRLLRVSFDRPCIVRLVDEMPLSTEEDSLNEGLVNEHFAYSVEGAAFARMQSEAWTGAWAKVTHFRFITGWTCMDVLTSAEPTFELVRDPVKAGP